MLTKRLPARVWVLVLGEVDPRLILNLHTPDHVMVFTTRRTAMVYRDKWWPGARVVGMELSL
jgi:hypothetical protein